MCRSWIAISTLSLTLFWSPVSALADSCSMLARQIRASASASNAEGAQLRAQIAAVRALEQQKGCTAEKAAAGGFFNSCRGLAQRRAGLERQASQARGGGPSSAALQARYRSLGCDAQDRRSREARQRSGGQQERLVKASTSQKSGGQYAGGALYYCVRPSDGYLFPAPKSQFGKSDYAKEALDQCRFICEDQTMALYQLESPEKETEEMVSLETKQPYSALPTVFRYQRDENFQACNWAGYFARVNEMRARTVTPRSLANAIIPVPTFRPRIDAQQVSSVATGDDAPALEVERAVRLVGPVYLPDEDIEIRLGLMRREPASRAEQEPRLQ